MAFSTYGELKTLVRKWTRRNDIDTFIDDVIDMAEAEMFGNAVEVLDVKELDTRATATSPTGARFMSLPTRFISMRSMWITTSPPSEIRQRSPAAMILQDSSGRPRYFSTSSQLSFDRTPDAAYALEMFYSKRTAALSASATTNTILTNYPNIYLHGCAWAAYDYAGEDQKAERRYQMFMSSIQGANKKDRKGRHGPAPTMASQRLTP